MFGYRRGGAPLNVLFLLGAMSFLLYVDRVNLSTAASSIQAELGMTNTQLGFAFSAFAYSYAVFQIVGGWIADRIGSRITLLVCGLIWVVTTIGTGLIGSFAALLAVRFVLGIGEGATLPAAGRALASWTPKQKRGFAQGVTHSCSRFGNAITPPLVAFLILTLSWRMSFVVLGLVTAVWVVVWWFYFRDDPRTHANVIPSDLADVPPYAISKGKADAVPWGPVIRRMAPTMVVYFCYGWTGWLFFTWLPVFFKHGYNLDIKNSAILASGVFFAGVVGDTVGGLVSDWVYRRTGSLEASRSRVIMVSLLAAAAFLTPVIFTQNLVVIAILLSAAFLMLELTIGPIWAVPMDVAPRYAGTASGLMNAGSAVAGIISPIIFGFVIDATGNWTLPFAGSIGLLVVGAIATFWIRPERQVETFEPPAPRGPGVVIAASDDAITTLAEALPDGIVDAHHHVWALDEGRYPWLQDAYEGERFFLGDYRAICRDYRVADLRRDSRPLRLAATVHVEAERERADQLGETRWLDGVHRRDGLPSVIVGHVSFLQPDLDAALAAHRRSALVRGIRSKPLTAASPAESVRGQAGSMQDARWLAGLARLEAHDLSWDLRVPFWHLAEAAEVASAFPGIAVVLNHCGLPLDRSAEGLAAWRRGMEALAACPNVSVKLSEFGLSGGRWDEASTIRVVREAAAIFGGERILYGSNLPVSGLSASLPTIVSAVLAGLGTRDPAGLGRVFSSNARRVYRI